MLVVVYAIYDSLTNPMHFSSSIFIGNRDNLFFLIFIVYLNDVPIGIWILPITINLII